MFEDEEFDPKDRREVQEHRVTEVRPEFLLPVATAAVAPSALPIEEISLVVSLEDLHLRRAEVVLERALSDVPESWAVPKDVRTRFAWRAGVSATVAIVLRKDRAMETGLPSLRGQWLERRSFLIRPVRDPHAFPIEKWSAEAFEARGLPRDTVFWVDPTTDNLNQSFDEPAEAFTLALRDDVYDALASIESTPAGAGIKTMILTEVVTDLLWAGISDLEPEDELVRSGVLYALAERVKRATGLPPSELRALFGRGDGRARLRAQVQAMMAARRDIVRLQGTQEAGVG